jgi:hypothetical protein
MRKFIVETGRFFAESDPESKGFSGADLWRGRQFYGTPIK